MYEYENQYENSVVLATQEDMRSLKPMVELTLRKRSTPASPAYQGASQADIFARSDTLGIRAKESSQTGAYGLSSAKLGANANNIYYDTISLIGDDTRLMSFSTKNTLIDVSNLAVLQLYDRDMFLLQNELSRTDSIVYRYGYYTSSGKKLLSAPYFGMINNWQSRITEAGTEHTLDLLGVGAIQNAHPSPPRAWAQDKISDIAKIIAEENGWLTGAEITETVPIEHNEKFQSFTEGQTLPDGIKNVETIYQYNESDMRLLHRLLPFAKAADTDAAYVCRLEEWVDVSVNPITVKKKLIFKPSKLDDKNPKRIYKFYRSQLGINPNQFNPALTKVTCNMIEYTPTFTAMGLLNKVGLTASIVAYNVETDTYDILQVPTGKPSVDLSKPLKPLRVSDSQENRTAAIKYEPDKGSVSLTKPLYGNISSGGMEEARLRYLKMVSNYSVYNISLRVLGDYNIWVTDTIYIEVLEPGTNVKSYLTGYFYIKSVEHRIVSGEFSTTIEAYRTALPYGDIVQTGSN